MLGGFIGSFGSSSNGDDNEKKQDDEKPNFLESLWDKIYTPNPIPDYSNEELKERYPGQYARLAASQADNERILKASPYIARMTPVLGEGIIGYQSIGGHDMCTNEELSTTERISNVLFLGLGKVGQLKKVGKTTQGLSKAEDFAKEPFLPDEYYQKLDNKLAKAIAARDAEVATIQSLSKTQQSKIATVVGGVDLRTGEVVVGVKNSIINKGNAICAEDLVFKQLGGNINSNIIMTLAIRPRAGAIIPVCTRCQTKFPVNQFIKGTVFD